MCWGNWEREDQQFIGIHSFQLWGTWVCVCMFDSAQRVGIRLMMETIYGQEMSFYACSVNVRMIKIACIMQNRFAYR